MSSDFESQMDFNRKLLLVGDFKIFVPFYFHNSIWLHVNASETVLEVHLMSVLFTKQFYL